MTGETTNEAPASTPWRTCSTESAVPTPTQSDSSRSLAKERTRSSAPGVFRVNSQTRRPSL